MPTTIIPASVTVEHEELGNSPQETYGDRGFRATRTLKCDWSSRHQLARELMGSIQASGSNITIIRAAPYPHFSGARVTDVQITPFHSDVDAQGGNTIIASYSHAQLVVQYSTDTQSEQNGTDENGEPTQLLIDERIEPFTEFITLTREKLYWDQGSSQTMPLESGAEPGIIVSGFNWVFDVKAMPLPIPLAVKNLVNRCNSTALTSPTLGLSFAAQTLLYRVPTIERQITTAGGQVARVVLTFSYRPRGWNKFYNPNLNDSDDDMNWASVYREGNSAAWEPYKPADLRGLVS